MLPLENSVIFLTCIKRLLVLKNNFRSFLRMADLHRFYCTPLFGDLDLVQCDYLKTVNIKQLKATHIVSPYVSHYVLNIFVK